MSDGKYVCGVCSEVYRSEGLKKACEEKPVEDPVMDLGTVFKCVDGLFGILYDTDVEEQTHERTYSIARTGLSLDSNRNWHLVPEISADSDYLSEAQPVSNEEFTRVEQTLRHRLRKSKPVPYIVKLRELNLVPLQ
jgi:hypothetical protein